MAEGEPRPQPKGCPRCGEAYHVIICYQDEYMPGSDVRSGCTLTGAELAKLHGFNGGAE
jgi:hypothetical protein